MSRPEKPPRFEQPDLGHIDEQQLLLGIQLPLTNPIHFTNLLLSNHLVVMAAHDHRCDRRIFEELLVTSLNFQNRAVRYAEMCTMLECLEEGKGFGTTDIKAERDKHLAQARELQGKLVNMVQLLQEMRTEEDPVS